MNSRAPSSAAPWRGGALRRTGLSAEVRFLLDVLAVPHGGPSPVPADGIDWEAVLAGVRHHRVAALMDPALMPGEAMPEAVRAALHRQRRQAAMGAMALCAETFRLADALAGAGIEALVLKGPALASQLYGDPLRRMPRDIDLLVRPEAMPAALAILAECGYGATPDTVSHHSNAIELSHPRHSFPVELHSRLVDDERLFPIAALRPFDTAVEVPVAGGRVRTLAPEAAVLFAAYHGTKHLWTRLFWLADMAAAARDDRLAWARVADLARRTGTERHLGVALRLIESLLGVPPPAALASGALPLGRRAVAAMRRFEAVLPLALGTAPLTDNQAMHRIGRLRTLRVELGLYRRLSARWAFLRCRSRPSDTDRALLRLPAGLDALYYGVRAMRVLGKAFRRV